MNFSKNGASYLDARKTFGHQSLRDETDRQKGGWGAGTAVAIIGTAIALSNGGAQAAMIAEGARDYGRYIERGDTAMADLAAIEIAIGVQDVVGDAWVSYLVLDILLQ